ncbi:MAG: hypothetical protein K8R41_09620 [Bacteroidales bacterium]|nr:hypothetical protein [Bacteroidales bacterium]
MFKASYIQFAPVFGNQEKNIKKLDILIDNSKQADLVVIPELANSGYNFSSRKEAFSLAEEIGKSEFVEFLESKAKKHNTFIVSGINEKENDKLFNTSILIGPNGFMGKYRKIHLFMNEKDIFEKGNSGLPVFDIVFCKLGMLVCFDYLFPEIWRILALKGSDIICHPSNFITQYGQKVVPVHAIINRIFTITANRIGTEKDLTFTGRSIISNPFGEIITQASGDEEIGFADIDISLSRNKMITERNHVFNDRQTEDYGEII